MNNTASINMFRVYSMRQEVNVNNIANMNTEGFKSQRTDLQERPDRDDVELSDLRQKDPKIIEKFQTEHSQNRILDEEYNKVADQNYKKSDTDIVSEFLEINQNNKAYSANAQVVQAEDRLSGEILNKMV